jgi:drug/metabolite transporter (DMT)-like permease
LNLNDLVLYAKATFAVVVWGASFIATKVVLREMSPYSIIWARFAVGLLVLVGVLVLRRQWAVPSRRDFALFVLLGFLCVPFHQFLQTVGLKTAQASTSGWIIATTPVFIALLGRFVLGERLGAGRIFGILLAASGVLVVVSGGSPESLRHLKFGTTGDLLMLVSALNWAVFSVLSRKALTRYSGALMMAWVMGLGWIMATPMLFSGPGPVECLGLSVWGASALLFLGVCCTGLAYVFWYDALQGMEASRVGVFMYLEPPAAVVVAAIVLGEPITSVVLLGGVLILFGVWLVNRCSPGLAQQKEGKSTV